MKWEEFSKIKINVFVVFLTGALCLGFSDSQTVWRKTWVQSGDARSRKVISDERTEGAFWLITYSALYHVDSTQNQSLILHKNVNAIYQDPKDPEGTYIAADDGIYLRFKEQLQRILFKHGCLSVVSVGGTVFAGTESGLMIRDGSNDSWHYASGELAQEPVSHLASYGDVIYAVTPSALYRYDSVTNEYKEIFSTGVSQELDSEGVILGDEPALQKPDIIDVDIIDDGGIYTSTLKGIYYSNNEGGDWRKLPDNGLPIRNINALSIFNDELWAATADGAYRSMDGQWQKLDNGLETNVVYDLIHDRSGNIYAATNRGFFYLASGKALANKAVMDEGSIVQGMFKDYRDVEKYFYNEPSVRQTQEMAVKYADVHPDKIKRWHRQSRLKAFAPTISTGIDRSASDLMHWDTGQNPDELTKGRDFIDWDVSLSWDLGDMVFSSDQTSIDSRSKLMVELREEVLDQVTRVYFERRRLQVTLLNHKKTGESSIEDEMRLAELTAIIDGFTGGEFSQRSLDPEGVL